MINTSKTGKFIAELRKKKGLTQEKLGEIIGINSKSISKWERGISFPDSSYLTELSSALDISVVEILNGEKIIEDEKKNKNNTLTVDGIKLYSKILKNKYSRVLLIIIFAFLFIFLLMYMINNYNKCRIYSINSLEKNATINGYIIFNPYKNLILINDISYADNYIGTDKEILVKNIQISLVSNDTTIYTKEYNTLGVDPVPISEYLNECSINIMEDVVDKNNTIKLSQLKNLYLLIEYHDQNDNVASLDIELNAIEEFKNSKLIY